MAYTLKASGIATVCTLCLAVDEDNTTIKEFVSSSVNSTMTFDTGVAAGVGTATWKGSTRGYFQTFDNGTYDYYGLRFGANKPSGAWSAGNPGVFVFIWNSSGTVGGNGAITDIGGGAWSIYRPSNKLTMQAGGYAGTTTLPANGTTKYSAAFNHVFGTGGEFFYGLESGSLASDGTYSDVGFGQAGTISGIGGTSGQGSSASKYHLIAKFSRVLTLLEMQSLHNDWVGTLFDSSGGGGGGTGHPQFLNLLGVA